jgi:4-hydroxyphenylpyruvate dioxygenase-like putative hemolysin
VVAYRLEPSRQLVVSGALGTTVRNEIPGGAMPNTANCVHHVVWCVKPESLPRVRAYCEEGLGLPMQDLDLPDLGIHVLISWEGGIEIMAPTYAEGTLVVSANDFLESRGEGVYSVVFNVGNLEDAIRKLEAQGAKLVFAEDIAAEDIEDRNLSSDPDDDGMAVRQALFDDVCGMRICLQELATGGTG